MSHQRAPAFRHMSMPRLLSDDLDESRNNMRGFACVMILADKIVGMPTLDFTVLLLPLGHIVAISRCSKGKGRCVHIFYDMMTAS
jgi:hypothetical protein